MNFRIFLRLLHSAIRRIVTVLAWYLGVFLFYRSCCYILNALRSFFKHLWHGLNAYASTGTISGTRYLLRPNYHYTERIFWLVSLICSFLLCSAVLRNYAIEYNTKVFKIVEEDRDINVPLQFPSIGVCEIWDSDYQIRTKQLDHLSEIVTRLYPALNSREQKKLSVIHRMFFQNSYMKNDLTMMLKYSRNQSVVWEKLFRETDFESLADKIRYPCEKLFHKCSWNEKSFNCCKYFRNVKTMLGNCFILNSQQTKSGLFKNLQITRYSRKSSIKFEWNKSVKLFILNPNDIPEVITPLPKITIETGADFVVEFSMTPMVNDARLATYSRNITKCFVGHEKYLDWKNVVNNTYKYVSYSTCITDCLRYLQYEKCNCVNYNYNRDSTVKHCDLKGYLCLEKHNMFLTQHLSVLKDTICGQCVAACDSATFEVLHSQQDSVWNGKPTLQLYIRSIPLKQLRRQIIRGDLDILVSLGGILSLCFGISLVSLFEMVYIILRAMLQKAD